MREKIEREDQKKGVDKLILWKEQITAIWRGMERETEEENAMRRT